MSDRAVGKTSARQHTTLTADTHPCPWRNSNLQSQQASGRRPPALPQRSAVLMNRELEMIIKEVVEACVKLSARIVRMRVDVLEHGVSKR
jgi:hypothetical protein